MQNPLRLATGGQSKRDCTQMLNMPGRWCLYGRLGQLSHELDAGGPLDAPDAMPAGAMNSTTMIRGPWHNGGVPAPCQSETRREA